MELTEGAVIADRFRLSRQLGKGGMGEVWLAQHTGLDIPCAVKFIHAETAANEEARTRFEREAKAAAQLRTPYVVQILDYGVHEEKTPYIAMELLEGEPLNARLSRHRRLDPHETFRIVTQVGKALGKAHAVGIVHRDLKPENVFLVADEDGEIAKVLDFGVAKQTIGLTNSNTRTGALLGTPYYMSPEQAQGIKAVDSRADLWSLAVLVYRCVTGELPFRSEALGDLLIKIVTSSIPVPSQVVPGIPDGFDAWWDRASQREPEKRFQTAKELVEALGMALGVSVPTGLGRSGMTLNAAAAGTAVSSGGGAGDQQSGPSWQDSGVVTPQPAHQPPATELMPAVPFASPPAAGQPGAAAAGLGPTVAAPPADGSGSYVAMHPPGATAAMPGPDGTGQAVALAGAPQPARALGESGSGPSVAGFATQTAQPAGPPKLAIIGGVLALALVVGGAGAFAVYRVSATGGDTAESEETGAAAGTDDESSADGEGVTAEPADGADDDPPPTEAASAEPDAAAPVATAEPEATTEPSSEPKTATPRVTPRPRPDPPPRATATKEPTPEPKHDPNDFGF